MNVKETIGKADGFFAKLPFKALVEKIPAGVRVKFPLLETAIPFANQIACALIAVITVTAAVTVIAAGNADGGSGEYIVGGPLFDGDVLNIRSEPDAGADNILAGLAAGEKVTLLEKSEMDSVNGIDAPWFLVRTEDGREGWVFSGYLTAVQPVKKAAEGDPLALLSGDWFLDGGNFWKISVSGGDWVRSRSEHGDKTWEVVDKGTVAAVKGKKNMFNATGRQAYGLDSDEWTIEWTLSADGTSFTMQDDVGGDVTYVKSARKD